MKSPTSSVGRIDDDGILNGSARNDRSRNTINKTGKNAFEYSTHDGRRKRGGSLPAYLENGEECLLRNLDAADRLHSLLARLLLLEQFLLPRHVAAVAFCQYVLAERLDRFTRDDLGADRRLDRHVEHLPLN